MVARLRDRAYESGAPLLKVTLAGDHGEAEQRLRDRADAAGLPCYLETESERNVTFYLRHGFEVLTEGMAPGHDVVLWTMARKPQR